MKSTATRDRIEVIKRINLGHIPLFLQLAHKGLEKSNPEGETSQDGTKFNVSTDLLNISVSNQAILENVERVDVVYQKPA